MYRATDLQTQGDEVGIPMDTEVGQGRGKADGFSAHTDSCSFLDAEPRRLPGPDCVLRRNAAVCRPSSVSSAHALDLWR